MSTSDTHAWDRRGGSVSVVDEGGARLLAVDVAGTADCTSLTGCLTPDLAGGARDGESCRAGVDTVASDEVAVAKLLADNDEECLAVVC